jgi:hypothetical protein
MPTSPAATVAAVTLPRKERRLREVVFGVLLREVSSFSSGRFVADIFALLVIGV